MATGLSGFFINITSDDVSYVSDPTKYIEFEAGADKLVFAASKPDSMDEADLKAAQSVLFIGDALEIPNLYLWDNSAGVFRYIYLAGSSANKYVFCFHMTGTGGTLSEPIVQVWDTSSHATNDLICLGEGDYSKSFIHGIETRLAGTPSPGWTGTLISGNNGLGLNGGDILSSAIDLYFNLYVKIPATVSVQEKEGQNPVFCLRYKYGD